MTRRQTVLRAALLLTAALLILTIILRYLPWMNVTERPEPSAPVLSPVPTPISVLVLPISFSLRELEHRLSMGLPDPLVEANTRSSGRHFHIRVLRAGEPKLLGKGRDLEFSLPVSFTVDAPSEGFLKPRLHTEGQVTLRMEVRFDIAEDWHPRVSAQARFDWQRRPFVRLGPFKIGVTGLIGEQIQKALDKQARKLEFEAARSLEIRDKADKAWRELHEPKSLRREPPVWLTMQPQAVHWATPQADKDTLRFTLALSTILNTVAGAQPSLSAMAPLPKLQRGLPQVGGFHLGMPVVLDFKGIAKELRRTQAGRRISVRGGAVVLRDFEVYAAGERLVLGVEFEADGIGPWLDTRGRVYLTGVPRYNLDQRQLSVEQFDFTRRVNNPLVRLLSWVVQAPLREAMQEKMRWDVTDDLLRAQEDLSADLNRELGNGLSLWGEVSQLALGHVSLIERGIELRFEATGELALMFGF